MKRVAIRSTALVAVLAVIGSGIYMAKSYLGNSEANAQVPAEPETGTPNLDAVAAEPAGAAPTVDPLAGSNLLNGLAAEAPPTQLPAATDPLGRYPAMDAASNNPLRGTPPVNALAMNEPAVTTAQDPFANRPAGLDQPAAVAPGPSAGAAPAPLPGNAGGGEPLGRYPSAPADAALAGRYPSAGEAPQQPSTSAPTPEVNLAPTPTNTAAAGNQYPPAAGQYPPTGYPAPTPAPTAAAPPAVAHVPASGQPGAKELEGPQTPSLQLEKSAPIEIQVGKPASFEIILRNVGQATARDVVVADQVPQGTRLIATSPQADTLAGGKLHWQLDDVAPGEEIKLAMEVMPTDEGEIGSVASVSFRAEATVRTVATKPELLLEVAAPRQVMIDSPVTLKVKLSNPGSGEATGVLLLENVPGQLSHPAGDELEFEVGSLKPNESREIELTLTAEQAGRVSNVISVSGDGNLETQTAVEFEVIAPQLQVALQGPKLRYLEREAKYQLAVHNPGTAPAKEIELVSHLPKGMKFVSANNAGQYDQNSHSVYWSLAELPEGETGAVELVTQAIEEGDQVIRVEGTADQGLEHASEESVTVEGIAALFFGVVDVEDPIEVGGQSVYEIRIVNQGTKSASGVRMVAQLPAGLKPISADGPTRSTIQGDTVMFEPLNRLSPKADTTYTIHFQGVAAGDQRVRVQVISADMQQPVTKEESTRVYADQ